MPKTTEPDLAPHIRSLARTYARGALYPKARMTVSCRELTGRKQSAAWTLLVAREYVAAKPKDLSGTVTAKAFNEVAAAAPAVALADKFTWDPWKHQSVAESWVPWDALTVEEQVALIVRHRADPEAVEFLAVPEHYHGAERFRPEQGEGPADAYVRLGKERDYWYGQLAVRDAGLRAKAEAAARADYTDRVAKAGLNPYLVSIDALVKDGAQVRLHDKSLVGWGPRLSGDPGDWTEESVAHYVGACQERVNDAEAALHAAKQFARAVKDAGGADAFRAAYAAAIAEHVDKHWTGLPETRS